MRGSDALPSCPSCGGSSFERSSLFEPTQENAVPRLDPGKPSWVGEARRAVARSGDHLAFLLDGQARLVRLPDGWTRIGRSLTATIHLDDPTVSRRHALIHRADGACTLHDDRSLNGVFLGGERTDQARLADGDTISLGRFTLHFVHVDPR